MKTDKSNQFIDLINLIFLILLFSFFVFIAISLVKNLDAFHNKDFFTFWLGGRLSSQGLDVYNQTNWVGAHHVYGSTWIPNLYYVYPLTTAFLFLPLGVLPIETAALIWLLISFILIVISLVLLLRLWQVEIWKHFVIPFTLALILFRPVVLIFLMGQIDALLLFLIVSAIYLISKSKDEAAYILLGFLIIKPNIGIPILGFYALWLIWQKQWKNLLFLSGSALVLMVLPLMSDINWISKYIQVGLYKSQDQNVYPTLRGLAGLLTGNHPTATTLFWLISSLLIVGIAVWIVLRRQNQFASQHIISFSIIVSLLITPYLRSYDLLLLLVPIMQILRVCYLKKKSFMKTNLWFLFWGFLSFSLLYLAVYLQHDIFSLLFTLLVLTIFCFSNLQEKEDYVVEVRM